MTVVVFDPVGWAQWYPEFSAVSPVLAAAYFAEAGIYVDNTGGSRIIDIPTRTLILWMVTAHIASLYGPTNGDAASPLVGRVSSASQGSVSVSTAMQVPGSAEWFAQSKYGMSAWAAMAAWRTMAFVPGPRALYNGLGRRFGFGRPY